MSGNSYGTLFRITTFGESHGAAIGVVIDGCPPGMTVHHERIRTELNRRRPGQSHLTTQRNETEEYEILSGVFEEKTLGTPIAIIVRNQDQRPDDYDSLKEIYRPSHADFTYQAKYGIRDHRGGGRQSARETVARVLAGAFAKMVLETWGIQIRAYVSSVHDVAITKTPEAKVLFNAEEHAMRCPEPETAARMESVIKKATDEGDSLGGTVSCMVIGLPTGLGEPVFDKLHAELAKAVMSINAAKGFEMGSGFAGSEKKGSEQNDIFELQDDKLHTRTNNSGGIQGGISNGEPIHFRVAFKPVATIQLEQETLNERLEPVIFSGKGRHDSCVVPRAVPIVEAMAALVLVDMVMRNQAIGMQPFG